MLMKIDIYNNETIAVDIMPSFSNVDSVFRKLEILFCRSVSLLLTFHPFER